MEEIIKIPARYGYVHTLKHISENLWSLDPDPRSSGYFRIIGNIGNIEAIDPDGGPFLSVGDKIEGKTIKSIAMNGLLELE